MKNTFRTYLLALVAHAAFAVSAIAQDPYSAALGRLINGESTAMSIGDDAGAAIICKYVGTSGKGYITVSATAITFESPDSSTADTSLECPQSGALGGIVDTTNAACDTVGEFLDMVNLPTSNFRCVANAALRTDDIKCSSNGCILAVTDKDATGPGGYSLLWDTSANWKQRIVVQQNPVVAPQYLLSRYLSNADPLQATLIKKPFDGTRSLLQSVSALSTYGSGTSTMVVYAVDQVQALGTSAGANAGATETVTTLWSEAAGATTVQKQFGSCDTPATACSPAWGAYGLFGPRNQKLIVALENSAAMSTTTFQENGSQYFLGR